MRTNKGRLRSQILCTLCNDLEYDYLTPLTVQAPDVDQCPFVRIFCQAASHMKIKIQKGFLNSKYDYFEIYLKENLSKENKITLFLLPIKVCTPGS